jgi:uncharacterized protein (TIGR00255 family)
MTGFGSSMHAKDSTTLTVEIKSLNSKFLDLALKMPRIISDKEIEIRNRINDELVRGKISFSIQYSSKSLETIKYNINQELFESYLAQFKKIELQSGRNFNDVLKLTMDAPQVIQQLEESIDSEEWDLISTVIQAAIIDCNKSRLEEGEKLATLLSSYIDKIREALTAVKEIEPTRLIKIKEKIKNTIKELSEGIEYDSDRLEQELIYYSEKLDINEETERLAIHLESYQTSLNSDESQHGKKLGFISQEIGREINTIGSKANNAEIQHHVIIMKEELEKIKEQTLNIL